MEKNYYEILEVDKNASDEIIEKAYKTLAKRYHPDLQNSAIKKENEEKMKSINQAYSVLSDKTQKNIYDEQLKDFTISREEYQNIVQENMLLRQELQRLQNNTRTRNINNSNFQNRQRQYNEQINRVVNQAYHDAYVQDMKNRGYRVKRKYTIKEYIKLAGILAGLAIILFILSLIPPIQKLFIDLYKNNIFIKALVDTLKTGF